MTDGPGLDLNALLQQAQQMGAQMMAAQQAAAAEAAAQRLVGQSGGGKVKITVTGAMEFLKVEIDPSVVDPAEADLLEDLVLAAIRDACTQAAAAAPDSMEGLDLGGLGGLLGGLGQ